MTRKENTRVIYPGTFDPITNGHTSIIERASAIFGEVRVAIAGNPSKKTMFTLAERETFARVVTEHLENTSVSSFSGLLVDFAKQIDINILVRGLRTTADFEYENSLADVYRKIVPSMESVFLTPTNEKYRYLSSTIVREIAIHGGDTTPFVHTFVANALDRKRDQI